MVSKKFRSMSYLYRSLTECVLENFLTYADFREELLIYLRFFIQFEHMEPRFERILEHDGRHVMGATIYHLYSKGPYFRRRKLIDERSCTFYGQRSKILDVRRQTLRANLRFAFWANMASFEPMWARNNDLDYVPGFEGDVPPMNLSNDTQQHVQECFAALSTLWNENVQRVQYVTNRIASCDTTEKYVQEFIVSSRPAWDTIRSSATIRSLTKLCIEPCVPFNDDDLAILTEATNITELDITASDVTPSGLKCISRLPLRKLGVGFCNAIDRERMHLTDELVELPFKDTLEELYIHFTFIYDPSKCVARHHRLTSLDLSFANVSMRDLKLLLRSAVHLTRLTLRECHEECSREDDLDLESFRRHRPIEYFTNITFLNIYKIWISYPKMFLARFPNVVELVVDDVTKTRLACDDYM